jgi:hypothetical protein
MVRNLAMGLCSIQVLGVPRGSLRTGRKLRSVVDLRKTLFSAEAAVPASRPV